MNRYLHIILLLLLGLLQSTHGNPIHGYTEEGKQAWGRELNSRGKARMLKGDADFMLLKKIRHGYLHLSAQGPPIDFPAKHNIRLIIDDSK